MALQVCDLSEFCFSLVSRSPDFWVRGQRKDGNPIFGYNFLSAFRICLVINTLKQYLQGYKAEKVYTLKNLRLWHIMGIWGLTPPKDTHE